MKKYIFILLISLSAIHAAESNLSPDNTVVAFDFHGVLVDTDYQAIAGLINYDFGKKVVYALPNILLKLPWWLPALFALKKQYPSSSLFPELAKQYTFFEPLVPTVIRMTNQQKVKPGIKDLLEGLRNSQYTLALASNISGDVLEDLQNNGDQEVKELLTTYFPVENRLIPTQANLMLRKPNPVYFTTLQNMFTGKSIIFFDDKLLNQTIAQQQGIKAFGPNLIPQVSMQLIQNAQNLNQNTKKIL